MQFKEYTGMIFPDSFQVFVFNELMKQSSPGVLISYKNLR